MTLWKVAGKMDTAETSVCPVCGFPQADIPSHMDSHTREDMVEYFSAKTRQTKPNAPPDPVFNEQNQPNKTNTAPVFIQQNPKTVIKDSLAFQPPMYNLSPSPALNVQNSFAYNPIMRPSQPTTSAGTHHLFQAVPMNYMPQQNNIMPNSYVICTNGAYPNGMPTMFPYGQNFMPNPMLNNMVLVPQSELPVAPSEAPVPAVKPDDNPNETVISVGDIKVVLPTHAIKKEDKMESVVTDLAKALLSVIKVEKRTESPSGNSEVNVYESDIQTISIHTNKNCDLLCSNKHFEKPADIEVELEDDLLSLTQVTVLGLEEPCESTESTRQDEIMSLKASETLGDSDTEGTPTQDFDQVYHKNYLFGKDPSSSPLSHRSISPEFVDFTAFNASTQRLCKQESAEAVEMILDDRTGSLVPAASYVPHFLEHLQVDDKTQNIFHCPSPPQLPDNKAEIVASDDDYKCKASTSGLQNHDAKTTTDDECYDLDFETDSEDDNDKKARRDPWKCSTCDTSFKSFKEKLLHSEVRHGTDGVKTEVATSDCHECDVLPPDALRTHKINMLNDATCCSVCHVQFESRVALLKHVRTHPKSSLRCPTCKKHMRTYHAWSRHQLYHMGLTSFDCHHCGKVFEKKSVLTGHLRTHTGEKPFKCPTCEKSFGSAHAHKMHLLTHVPGHTFDCESCRKQCATLASLNRHKQRSHPKGQRVLRRRTVFMCSVCNEVMPSEKKLAWHSKTHQRWPHKCDTCGECFVHKSYLTRHIRHKHDVVTDPKGTVKCAICRKQYKASSMGLHMRIHTDSKPFQCRVCNRGFRVKCNLVNHMWVHAGKKDRPFKCTLCDKSFTRDKFLAAHVRSHKNIRPYTCNECGKAFIYKHNLQNHLRQHTGEKPFACIHCDKRFFRKYNLDNHERIHTGETPFECSICRKEFTQKSNYNAHMKAFHAERHMISEEV